MKNIMWQIVESKQDFKWLLLSYKCEMPEILIIAHPVGSVIGNAKYSNGLYISQNVTINTHMDEKGEFDLHIGKYCF